MIITRFTRFILIQLQDRSLHYFNYQTKIAVISFRFRILPDQWFTRPIAEFKEFERRFKFKPRFKYGWFHLKLYQMFQDLSRRLI